MEISVIKNDYAISFGYRPHLVSAVKLLPGRKWDDMLKVWLVPLSHKEEVDRFRLRFGFKIVTTKAQPEEIAKEEIQIKSVPTGDDLDLSFMKLQPYHFQRQGIAYGIDTERLIIGDQPGLGKTIQSIGIVTYVKAFPCLVICPSSLKENWKREWEKVTGKKAMILSDAVRRNYKLFYEAGLADVFIVNYESLKKYFVASIAKEKKWTLKDVLFRNEIDIFKSVIIDELHRCFPYKTQILTNIGFIPIGSIVENNLSDLLVASINLSDLSISFNKIKTLWKNGIGQRKIYRIKHATGYLYGTEDHKVYTSTGRYKEIREIQSGDYLWMLREEFLDSESWENNCEILLKKLCLDSKQCQSSNESSSVFKGNKTPSGKNLRRMWKGISYIGIQSKKVLWKKLFGKMENETAGNTCDFSDREVQGKSPENHNSSNAKSRIEKDAFGSNEGQQSHADGRNFGESFSKIKRTSFLIARWQWTIHKAPITIMGGIKFAGKLTGISNFNKFCKKQISKCCTRLQIRYCDTRYKTFNRSGRPRPQKTEGNGNRSVQNNCIELVRVDSCEVYESTNYGRFAGSTGRSETVYDLEIAENHNYFADGILVSNCKSTATHQSKFAKGITSGKKYVIGLTGTPVVNKPKDLVSQLFIINQMNPVFGNYKHFVDTYCAGNNEASNLPELNAKLRNNCFIRREKQAVLTDLPDKQRQVVICQINNRKEYDDAERDLIKYLVDYKDASNSKIASALRGEIMVKIGILKNISARGKLAEVCEFVDDIIESGEKLILFIHLKEVATALLHKYHGAVSITGADNMEARQSAVDRFQRDPKVQLIICSIKAAGVGLTLTAASRVGFVEFPWTYADCEQCEDRAHRIGQKDSVTCYYFLGKNTIDSKIYKIIQAKKAIAQAVTGSEEQIPENIVDMVANLFNQKDDDEE